VGKTIADELGSLRKRRAVPFIVDFFRQQTKGLENHECEDVYRPAVQSVMRALEHIYKKEPF
jgi:hypothetical protein